MDSDESMTDVSASQSNSTASQHSDLASQKHLDSIWKDHDTITVLSHGATAVVFTSIPKDDADEILQRFVDRILSREQVCDQLRAVMQAAKIANHDEGNFEREIETLRNLEGRSHIVQIMDWDEDHGWMTLELFSGGTLEQFENRADITSGASNLPPAFGWHMIAELAAALLELHFGITNDIYEERSIEYAHTDIHGANMMFRSPGAYEDYPDLVLVDLGDAKGLSPDLDDSKELNIFYMLQINDLDAACQRISDMIGVMAQDDPRLTDALSQLGSFQFRRSNDDTNERFQIFLDNVLDESRSRRQGCYRALRPDLASYTLKSLVSDEDLAGVYPDLNR